MAARPPLLPVLFTLCPLAAAQPAGQPGAQPSQPAKVQTLLVVEKSDLSQLLVDPRDRRLRDALAMIPARISEIPDEAPQFDPRAAAGLTTFLTTLARPGRLAITVNAGDPADGFFGYGIAISAFAKDQKDAQALHEQVRRLLEGAPLPPPPPGPKRLEGLEDVQLPGAVGKLSFGPRQTPEGWRYEVIVGTMASPDPAWANLPKPTIEGVTPVLRGTLDFAGLTPAATMIAGAVGPQVPQVQQMVREAGQRGFYGDKAMKVHFEYGYTASESRGRMTVAGAGMYKDKLYLPSSPLEAPDFVAVPADATMATISRGDLAFLDTLLDSAAANGAPVEAALADFKDQTGVDLREDIIRTLGGTIIYYLSDATGGGGVGSVAALISFKDRERFAQASDKLRQFANSALAQIPDVGSYISLAPWKEEGFDLVSLRFSGLPVPAEITYALTEKWLVAGFTPQAVIAAARQVSGKGDKGLMDNPKFAATAKGRQVVAASFVDTPRMMRTGYPIASLIGSAVANAVRSPAGAAGARREVGLVVPPFHDLAREARSSVMLTYWKGDDYVIDSHGDRSLLVSCAAGAGVIVNILPAIAIPAAAIGAAVEHQKNRSRQHQNMDGVDQMEDDAQGAEQSTLPQRPQPNWGLLPDALSAMLRLDPLPITAVYDAQPRAFLEGPRPAHN